MRHRFATMAFAGCLLLAGPTTAATVHGIEFADRATVSGSGVNLHRAALMKYLFFDVYVAGLYLAPGVAASDLAVTDEAHRLEIHYLMDFSADDFRKSTIDGIRRNVGADAFTELEDAISTMNALYEDIEEGDRYSVTFVPGVGTELAKNGRTLGVVPGLDFARAYFAIWFGPDPFDADLKRALLEPR